MGFTGKKALRWKNDFFDAFEAMEKVLLRQQNESWKAFRLEGKESRNDLTRSIHKLVLFAEKSGSRNANHYYVLFSKLIYKSLFGLQDVPEGFRNTLDEWALKRLQLVESHVALWLDNDMVNITDYRQPYKNVKQKIADLVKLTGGVDQQQLAA